MKNDNEFISRAELEKTAHGSVSGCEIWGYECGASYRPKSQCQTHTNVYWGICPKAE